MKNARPLLLAASAVALLISACSQAPADLTLPELEPQYGTANNDIADNVAVNKDGLIYTLGQSYDTYVGGDTRYATSVLTRFDRSGKRLWTLDTGNFCQGNFNDYCGVTSFGVGVDTPGNSYTFTGTYKDESDLDIVGAGLRKYSAAGKLLWVRGVYSGNGTRSGAMATTPTGETYVAFTFFNYSGDESATSTLRKYSLSGKQLWEVPLSVTSPEGVAVSSSGNVYVVGRYSLTKYGAGGTRIWTRSLNLLNASLAISGSNSIYITGAVDNEELTPTLLKYDAAGTRVFERRANINEQFKSATTDSSGNVYVGGTRLYQDDYDYLVRKYTPAGNVVWTSSAVLSKTHESVNGIAALSSGELYAAGLTDGKVNGTNFGKLDAFLLRLDGQGKRVWSR